jgi:O6-methylguanine-DNA--protein-cysteine methyltransferase
MSRPALERPAPYAHIVSLIGPLHVVVSDQGLCRLVFGTLEDELAAWGRRVGLRLVEDCSVVYPYLRQIEQYFDGTRRQFDLPVDLSTASPFTRNVLQVAGRIPFGQMATYQDIA